MTNVAKIRIYVDDSGEWRWQAKAGNGEIVATGESHTRPADAVRAARAAFPDVVVVMEPDVVPPS